MLRRAWRAAAVFALLNLTTAIAVGADAPGERNSGIDRLPPDAARMYRFVKTPHPGELRWQEIPWLTDLGEALRQAKIEGRPLLLFVSGDEPLERC